MSYPSGWYVACRSVDLKSPPSGLIMLDTPIALLRSAEKSAARMDQYAPRNAPLSKGEVQNNLLECPYHGWKYDAQGVCKEIPGLVTSLQERHYSVPSFPVLEQQGYVWIFHGTEQ